MSRFTRHGSAVRCEGDPFAACVDETAAMMVCNALRALEDATHSGNPVDAMLIMYPYRGMLDPAAVEQMREHCEQRVPPTSPFADTLPERTAIVRGIGIGEATDTHYQRRECDEMVCSCGLRWAVDEDDPHPTS